MSKRKTRRVDYWHDPDAPKPTSRKPSASALVRGGDGRVLMLRRTDNGLWTIPTGGVKKNETVAQTAVRECREETGIDIEITGLVGVFSDPGHVIAYLRNGEVNEVRQPINVCVHAVPVGGALSPAPDEASEVRWVVGDELDAYDIHPAIRARIDHGLHGTGPFIG